MPPWLIGHRMTQNTGKIRLRTAGNDSGAVVSRSWGSASSLPTPAPAADPPPLQLELSGECWHSEHFQTSLLCTVPWQCCGFVPPGGPGQEPAMNFCSRKAQLRMWQQLWGPWAVQGLWMGQCRKFNGPHSPGLVFTPNTTKGTADSTTWGHSPLTAVGHRCGTLWGWQQWPPPPAGTAILLSPGCTAKTPLHCSQPCHHQHLCRWQNLKRQMDGKIPGWADHGAGDVSSRSQRDWTHIYPGLFQCFSWPWGQVLLTAICLMLGNNLKQTSKLFFFN